MVSDDDVASLYVSFEKFQVCGMGVVHPGHETADHSKVIRDVAVQDLIRSMGEPQRGADEAGPLDEDNSGVENVEVGDLPSTCDEQGLGFHGPRLVILVVTRHEDHVSEAVAEPVEGATDGGGFAQWNQVASEDEHISSDRYFFCEGLTTVGIELEMQVGENLNTERHNNPFVVLFNGSRYSVSVSAQACKIILPCHVIRIGASQDTHGRI